MRLAIFILCIFAGTLFARADNQIIVNNRILLQIQDKPITVMDVVKKMDLYFYQQFPLLVNTAQARYEFYMMNFQPVLASLINDFLIVADAKEKEVETTDGDVREEMEKLFGPEVVKNIDAMHLSYEEAWELLKRELTVRKMTQAMVRSKAICEVYPKEMRVVYEDYTKANPSAKEWVYQILQIQGNEKEVVESMGAKVHAMLQEGAITLSQLPQKVEESAPQLKIVISEEFVRGEKEISLLHKEALQFLTPLGGCSAPLVQVNKKEGGYSAKLFVLKEMREKNPQSFFEMEDKIQKEILQKATSRHTMTYVQKLRERHGLDERYLSQMIPSNFVPFQIK